MNICPICKVPAPPKLMSNSWPLTDIKCRKGHWYTYDKEHGQVISCGGESIQRNQDNFIEKIKRWKNKK